jgi:UDP-N-acetylglucosamine 4-epimerase
VLKGKRILITGGAGFIGSNLCEYFLQNNTVVCFDNLATGHKENILPFLNAPNFKFIEGDIRNLKQCKDALQNIDIVLHQAALGSVPRSIADPITSNEVNVTGFLNMLHAAHEAGIKRFVYASSSSVYGDLETLPKTEDKIGLPMSPYAVTKLMNEHYAQVFHRLHGMEIIGLRYFNVFGKNQDPNGQYAAAIPRFIKGIIDNVPPSIFGDGSQTRDFTYIRNVIHANEMAALCTNPTAFGKAFNIAYGHQTTVNELIQVLLIEVAKHLPEKKEKILSLDPNYLPERKGDVKFSRASIAFASTVLNYHPQYDFEKGIQEAVEWYVKNL